jgi:hypothetical protein
MEYERMYNMNNKLLLPSLLIALAATAIAFFVTPKGDNPGFVSILTFMLVFLGAAAFLNLIDRKKRKKEEDSANN